MSMVGFVLLALLIGFMWAPKDLGEAAAKVHKAYLSEMKGGE